MAVSGPDGGLPVGLQGLLVQCHTCDAELFVRSMEPLWQHRCHVGAFEEDVSSLALGGCLSPGFGSDSPRYGRGEDLLTAGDVQSNPGTSPPWKEKGVVWRRSGDSDVDMSPSVDDPTFVCGCPGGPELAALPRYAGGSLVAPPPLANHVEDPVAEWDGDLAHDPPVTSDPRVPKRGRSTGPNVLWVEPGFPVARSTSAPPLAPATSPVTPKRLLRGHTSRPPCGREWEMRSPYYSEAWQQTRRRLGCGLCWLFPNWFSGLTPGVGSAAPVGGGLGFRAATGSGAVHEGEDLPRGGE